MNSHERTYLALEQGLYAAGLIPPPFDFQGKKLGFNSLARADEILTYPEDGLIATMDALSQNVKGAEASSVKRNDASLSIEWKVSAAGSKAGSRKMAPLSKAASSRKIAHCL